MWQLALQGAVYLVDAVEGGNSLMQACKPGLESPSITKVVHDCKRDSEVSRLFALWIHRTPIFLMPPFWIESGDVTFIELYLQALYFQYGIRLNKVFDTQVPCFRVSPLFAFPWQLRLQADFLSDSVQFAAYVFFLANLADRVHSSRGTEWQNLGPR